MKNAPWDADDREVLREKLRMANETASQCERLLHKVELLRIRVDHVAERTSEHDELAVDARKMFIAVGKNLLESGLTMADWKWFVENRIPDEPDQWQELCEHWQQAEKLKDLFHCLEEFVRAIAKAKRKFADAIRLSLNGVWQRILAGLSFCGIRSWPDGVPLAAVFQCGECGDSLGVGQIPATASAFQAGGACLAA